MKGNFCIQIEANIRGRLDSRNRKAKKIKTRRPNIHIQWPLLIVITLVQPKNDNNNWLITISRWSNFQKTRLIRASFKDYVFLFGNSNLKVITITKLIDIFDNNIQIFHYLYLHKGLVPWQIDNINGMITLTGITISGGHCIFKQFQLFWPYNHFRPNGSTSR